MKNMKMIWLFAWIMAIATGTSSGYCAVESIDDRRPPEHFCPITLELILDPVVAADGHSYEKSAILKHFAIHSTSPATGAALDSKALFANQALKAMIMEWKPGAQSSPGALDGRDARSIVQRMRQEFDRNAVLLNSLNSRKFVTRIGYNQSKCGVCNFA